MTRNNKEATNYVTVVQEQQANQQNPEHPENKEKDGRNYKSRYDRNRECYRIDRNHYVYRTWVKEKGAAFWHSEVLTVGKNGVTYELLDYMLETDNSEVQDQEDDARVREKLKACLGEYAKSREEELCEDQEENLAVKAVREKVLPFLSDEQKELIYLRFGLDMTQTEIALILPPGEDGKPISYQAVQGRLNRIFKKVKKHMPEGWPK